jgi:hypothetical protein
MNCRPERERSRCLISALERANGLGLRRQAAQAENMYLQSS